MLENLKCCFRYTCCLWEFDGYWQRELNYWDIAAGIIKRSWGIYKFFEEDKNNALKRIS